MERDDPLHELHVAGEAGEVVGEELDRGDRTDTAGVERGGVHMAALHQAEHLPGVAADLERLTVELAFQRVQRAHDVGDGAVAVVGGVRGLGALREFEDAGVGLPDHPLAVVHADQVLLEDVVVEHVLGGLAGVDDPLAEVRGRHAVRHVLCVDGTGGVVVAADAADAAGDEVGVAGVLALHEDAVAAEDRRGAVALRDPLRGEVDLRVDAEAADDARDGSHDISMRPSASTACLPIAVAMVPRRLSGGSLCPFRWVVLSVLALRLPGVAGGPGHQGGR